jgi:hypothetical protein
MFTLFVSRNNFSSKKAPVVTGAFFEEKLAMGSLALLLNKTAPHGGIALAYFQQVNARG